jgi:hypothetical protein
MRLTGLRLLEGCSNRDDPSGRFRRFLYVNRQQLFKACPLSDEVRQIALSLFEEDGIFLCKWQLLRRSRNLFVKSRRKSRRADAWTRRVYYQPCAAPKK